MGGRGLDGVFVLYPSPSRADSPLFNIKVWRGMEGKMAC